MRKNGIILQKCVDPLTSKKRIQPTMLLFHWWLYVLDDMIKAECKQHQKENSKGEDEKKKFTDTLWYNIPISTEHQEIEEMPKLSKSWPGECTLLLYYKMCCCCVMFPVIMKQREKLFFTIRSLLKQ
ncbi:hypothetical protein [Bartonella grahamii]|uniref:hypothetical protein n=1 Tax=Bartonella grahamii TaxID=33045 RepID=UPI002E7BD7A3|nr:hypothetical protein [Bartonella grahamii]